MSNKSKKQDPAGDTIFEEEKQIKKSATKVLELAKKQEAEKLKSGFRYESSPDGKTKTLRKVS